MSSLSYRKRSNLKDSIGGQGDESSLFSTLKEQSDTPDRSSLRKAKCKSTDQDDRKTSQDDDDRGSVISQAYSEATSRARKGLERRWAPHSPDFDKDSMVSSLAPSRSSRRAMPNMDDDNMSTISSITSVSRTSPRGLRRSTSWKDDGRSDSYGTLVSPSMSRRSGGRSPGSVSKADSRISVARSSRLSEFGLRMDDDDDALSMAFSQGTSAYSPHSLGRSFSTPAQPRSSDDNPPDTSDIKAVSHRNYLDPDLEKAINEVLSFKPIKFKRSKLEESDDEEENEEKKDDRNGVKGDDEGLGRSASSVRRSASGSAVDYSTRSSSSISSHSTSSSHRGKAKKKSSSDSSSDSDDRHSRKSSKKKGKKSRKGSRKKESESESSSESSSSSSSASTVSYRSSNSVKRGPARPASDEEEAAEQRPPSKKDEKKKKKKMDSMVMKYLYKPDSD
uniref:Uncharacterized protein n=1 Tax=Hucho hucho TaxID=62062 RepID=A0A4W5KCL9_9TELE